MPVATGAKILLGRTADVAIANVDGDTTLHAAAKIFEQRKDYLALILERVGAFFMNCGEFGLPVLQFAARNGDVENATLLLNRGADVNCIPTILRWYRCH